MNIEDEQIYNATRIFTLVFGTFLLITVLFIAYILLKTRVMAQLAMWGLIEFTHSGVYPLTNIELKLRIR